MNFTISHGGTTSQVVKALREQHADKPHAPVAEALAQHVEENADPDGTCSISVSGSVSYSAKAPG